MYFFGLKIPKKKIDFMRLWHKKIFFDPTIIFLQKIDEFWLLYDQEIAYTKN